jgi:hypothetical protein
MGALRMLKFFKVRETGNAEFWVSHFIILLSTVVGVYLAALAGYRTAVEFEVTSTDRQGYYLRRALLDEVKQNFVWADAMADGILKDWRAGFPGQKVKTFIWETMKEQNITFQLSPEILGTIREYYDDCDDYTRTLSPGGGVGGSQIEAEAWKQKTKKARDTVVPILEKELAELRAEFVKNGIPIR